MKTLQFAIYKNVQYGWTWGHEVTEAHETNPEYVRITNIVEVEFQDRAEDEVIQAQLTALKAAKEEFTVKALAAIKEIDRREQELLAITHQEEQ